MYMLMTMLTTMNTATTIKMMTTTKMIILTLFKHFLYSTGALTAMLRDLVLLKMGRYGDPDTVKEARKRFEDHCSGKSPIPADLRATVSDICSSISVKVSGG